MAPGRDPAETANLYRRKLGLPRQLTFEVLAECTSGFIHIDSDWAGREYGRFDVVHGHPRIRVHHGSASRSAVYTLAHELGHYLYRAGSLQSPDEEAWCHEFAQNLTMPADLIKREVHGRASASVVAEMAHLWGVGILDAASRVCQVLEWSLALIWFDPDKAASAPALSGSYGLPTSLKYRIVVGSGWDVSKDGQPTFVKIRIDSSDDFVPATFALTDGGYVLAAILFEDLRSLELRHRPMPRSRQRIADGRAPTSASGTADTWWHEPGTSHEPERRSRHRATDTERGGM